MSTARSLCLIFGILLVFSLVAYIWRPIPGPAGKVPLVWVSDNNPARVAQIQAFNEEHPGLNLVLDSGNGGTQKIVLQCASGVGPDIFDFGSEDIQTLTEAGVLMDVTEAAKEMGFAVEKNLWPSGTDTVSAYGRQYGYPCNIGTNIVVYNKNVFDYFGIPYPQGILTWDEFSELAQKVNSLTNAPAGNKRSIFGVGGLGWRIFFESMRGEFFSPEGQLQINTPELKKAFEMHKEFLFTDRVMPSTVEAKAMSSQGGWGGGNLNQFAAGRFSMIVTGHWSLIAFSQAYKQSLENFKRQGINPDEVTDPFAKPLRIGAIMIPKFPDLPPTYRLESRVAGVNSKSPRREQALAFLQYLAGPTYSKLINESSDWLPGNPAYASLGIQPGPAGLDRINLQKATTDAVAYGYCPRLSPFLLNSDVMRTMTAQTNRLESNPSLSVDAILQSAEYELKTLMRRNLDRNLDLKKLYIERFGETAYRELP